jgi:glutamyl-tRNA(Gln) amidotransferase subunit E
MTSSAEAPAGGSIRPPGDLNPRADPALDFPDRPLHAMSPADYDELGFLSGLEVHQQLHTRSKLFCRCPAGVRTDRVHAEVLRHMRPTLSELGEYDGTALMEFKTRKEIVYLLERSSVCTYEMDDTPPFGLDPEAVRIAIELAMLCDLNLVSELHVMRKQYLDGSIPTGFQRTVMVGLTGAIPLSVPELGVDRTLRIRQLSLEEDSCREVSDVGHRITFRTDRLGMPLSEVVTEPDLLTPWELQAGGRLIARLARATGKVRRGAGAARQDVNVSVAGGRRVEIKGVPHHRGLPFLVHNEAFRQLQLLRLRAELQRRGVDGGALAVPDKGLPWDQSPLVADASGVLARTGFSPLRRALDRGDVAVAVRLPGFGGLLAHPTQPGLTFAHELAERVRVIACPPTTPFMAHSDDGEATLGQRHWREVARAVAAGIANGADDAVVVVWAPRDDAATAAREILARAAEALVGIPAETRQAREDGTTGFERVLPGPDRMYPDTDTPPLPIADALVAEIRDALPERPWDREARYRHLGLPAPAASRLAGAPWAALFDDAAPAAGDAARTLAAALEKRIPYHVRRALGRAPGDPEDVARVVTADRVAALARALEAGEVLPWAAEPALDDVVRNPGRPAPQLLAAYRPLADDEARLRARAREAIAAAAGLRTRDPDAVLRWAMGEVLRGLRGRVDPVAVRAALEAEMAVEASP